MEVLHWCDHGVVGCGGERGPELEPSGPTPKDWAGCAHGDRG